MLRPTGVAEVRQEVCVAERRRHARLGRLPLLEPVNTIARMGWDAARRAEPVPANRTAAAAEHSTAGRSHCAVTGDCAAAGEPAGGKVLCG